MDEHAPEHVPVEGLRAVPADGGPAPLVVVTGMSGAGRSTVAKALEDHGWHVVENLSLIHI